MTVFLFSVWMSGFSLATETQITPMPSLEVCEQVKKDIIDFKATSPRIIECRVYEQEK